MPGPLACLLGDMAEMEIVVVKSPPLVDLAADGNRVCSPAAVEQQVHKLIAEAVGLEARRMPGQPLARPLLGVVVPPGGAQHLHDFAIPVRATQILGQHRDVGVDVAGHRGQLLPEIFDAHVAVQESGSAVTPRSSVSRATSARPRGPRALANSLSSMAGQPGPSSCMDTSHLARRPVPGGAARQARAYSAISVRRSSPTIPAESSMYISAAVTRSTARRASGPALSASPASIVSATAAATAWARWEYSRRPL